jgi:hypothetical protein
MTQMQADQSVTLILKDQAGDYFLVPYELIERHRAPAEQKAEVERTLAAAAPIGEDGDDAQGFVLLPMGIVLIAAAVYTADAIRRVQETPK